RPPPEAPALRPALAEEVRQGDRRGPGQDRGAERVVHDRGRDREPAPGGGDQRDAEEARVPHRRRDRERARPRPVEPQQPGAGERRAEQHAVDEVPRDGHQDQRGVQRRADHLPQHQAGHREVQDDVHHRDAVLGPQQPGPPRDRAEQDDEQRPDCGGCHAAGLVPMAWVASPERAPPASSPVGAGVSAAATITSANAAILSTTPRASPGSGSRKTTGPAAIVTTLAAVAVMAITATTGPIWRLRAETVSPASDATRITSASGRASTTPGPPTPP